MEKESVIGVVNAKDVITALKNHAKGYSIRQIEKTDLITFDYSAPIGKVITTLKTRPISHLPITDKNGNLIGVVSIMDILEKLLIYPPMRSGSAKSRGRLKGSMKKKDSLKSPIENEMSKNVQTMTEDHTLIEAIDLMLNKNLSDVIIIKDNKPTGIITVKDILKLFSVV
jgi:CBS domain-containing protein